MPLYEYKCDKCGDVFEIIQRFSDTPLTVHEKCGGQLERLVSVSALQFKGSGWYVNDYGKGNNKEPKPKTEKSNGTSGSESSGKSDSSSDKSESSSKSESSGKSDSSSKTDSASSNASKPSASKTDSK